MVTKQEAIDAIVEEAGISGVIALVVEFATTVMTEVPSAGLDLDLTADVIDFCVDLIAEL
jgi:hypothetical protein